MSLLEDIDRRVTASVNQYSGRDRRLAQLFKAYDGDIWQGDPAEGEQRVTINMVADVADMDTAILISKPPIITIPASKVSKIDAGEASTLENALVGAWNMMGLHQVWQDAVWFACLTGWGIVRGPIDVPDHPIFPLVAYAVDPRECYPGFTADKRLLWNIYTQYQTVGDIREEVPQTSLGGVWHPNVLPKEDELWARKTEYWGWHGEELYHGMFVGEFAQDKPAFVSNTTSWLPKSGISAVSYSGKGAYALKDPTVMNKGRHAYPYIPFRYFFPRARPRSESGMEGMSLPQRIIDLQKILSMLATILATDAFNRGNTPMWGDGSIVSPRDANGVGYINTMAAGFTEVSPGTHLDALPTSMDAPLVKQLYDLINDVAGRASFPPQMFGQYQAAMSGLAMSTINNPILIKEKQAQVVIEQSAQRFNSDLLVKIRQLPKSTAIMGTDKRGEAFSLSSAELPSRPYTYNIVQLSASLPKDIPQTLAAMVQLAQVKGIARRTLMEQAQNLLDLPDKDPQNEWEIQFEEEVQLAKDNIDAQARIAAYRTMQQEGVQVGLGPNAEALPVEGAPGAPPTNMAPQAMPQSLQAQMGMAGNPVPGGMIPGPMSGEMGVP